MGAWDPARRAAVAAACAALLWAVLVSLFGDVEAFPGGSIFAVFAIFVASSALGTVAELVGLPPLVGGIVAGFCLSNIPGTGLGSDLNAGLASALRGIALVIILTRAGLGLDRAALVRLSGPALRLAVIPNFVEAATAAAVLSGVLGWPIEWGALAGFVLSAVSPAVVVPSLLRLQDQGLGVDKGIPTLIMAAASFDDVIAISGFGVCLSLAFSEGDPVWAGVKSPLELIAGAAFGLVMGLVAGLMIPARGGGGAVAGTLLIGIGVVAVLGSRLVHLDGGGALGVIVAGMAARAAWDEGGTLRLIRAVWNNRGEKQGGARTPDGVASAVTPVGGHELDEEGPHAGLEASAWLRTVWTLVGQPMLFGLIGAAVDISVVDLEVLGIGAGALFAGLVVRCIAAFLCMLGTGFELSEQAFIALAWLPKATVQAAIGSIALDTAVSISAGSEAEKRGLAVLTIAVLAIVVTAPVGAVLISVFGHRWLAQKPVDDGTNDAAVSRGGGDDTSNGAAPEEAIADEEPTPLPPPSGAAA
ncbi:hypothetical protein FNF31_05195 [Cafeteria roenbergensis]|uniref:Cation/H+ exchanger transmembrane domain-containing protein n=1 Tax=Cafeteria roenbergensis TaxID=33653 RepID=A0A5A8DE87_CAFRO|nr:hypothetical protein FNF31_05195 [Cafeteria roenbergensis]KAA0163716.1 hypothetical protein FNF28_04107 [Cafeteria roenbergensis]